MGLLGLCWALKSRLLLLRSYGGRPKVTWQLEVQKDMILSVLKVPTLVKKIRDDLAGVGTQK